VKDPWNPTAEEIRQWAAEADSYCPDQDWALLFLDDSNYDALLVELAGDAGCPRVKRDSFLTILYKVVAAAVCGAEARSFSDLGELFRQAEATRDIDLRLWVRRSRQLIANPRKYRTRLCWRGTGL
jgi:hypothetical protein